MQRIQAYLVGALLMFGSATWAAIFAQNITSVLLLMAVPSMLCGYVYATALPQYVWGMLLGICVYMMAEYLMYGPVYKVTGLIYGIGYVIAIGFAFTGYAVYRWKCNRQQAGQKKEMKPETRDQKWAEAQ
ncbi:hypothetical protein [Porticoccus litoralis]|jgi:hypothetical protein|uniref:DUF2069 domain-containing protein n=1 Tax=Porticoccus litoralis TaxID=434086 RepID=A0AAW8B6V6_9GAMM|nr:hypothetical protein [Porticoccus litoralis]MDP1521378.1 hypothetical protein [Porticoccus litoralis]TNE89508.1 MAG: hypothetical protein EP324_06525 [Gammaproteobacteria bacterium]